MKLVPALSFFVLLFGFTLAASFDAEAAVGNLVARQAPAGNASATAAAPAASAGSTNTTGAAAAGSAAGGDATVSAQTNQGACQMTNKLSVNQQASWSNGIINTCCVFATYSQCYLRIQSSVSGSDACEIPDCADLATNDRSKMIGFNALNSTNGQGTLGNIYPSFGQGNAAPASSPRARTATTVAGAAAIVALVALVL